MHTLVAITHAVPAQSLTHTPSHKNPLTPHHSQTPSINYTNIHRPPVVYTLPDSDLLYHTPIHRPPLSQPCTQSDALYDTYPTHSDPTSHPHTHLFSLPPSITPPFTNALYQLYTPTLIDLLYHTPHSQTPSITPPPPVHRGPHHTPSSPIHRLPLSHTPSLHPFTDPHPPSISHTSPIHKHRQSNTHICRPPSITPPHSDLLTHCPFRPHNFTRTSHSNTLDQLHTQFIQTPHQSHLPIQTLYLHIPHSHTPPLLSLTQTYTHSETPITQSQNCSHTQSQQQQFSPPMLTLTLLLTLH